MKRFYWMIIICLILMATSNVKKVDASSKFTIEEDCGEIVLTKYSGKDKVVRVPNGVTLINGAFKKNKHIKKIILPKSVKEIWAFSFYDLKNLKEIKLSKKLIRVEASAFINCPKVKKIVIPKRCKYLEGGSIAGCYNLRTIKVEKGNRYFKVKKGALYTKNMTRLLLYPDKCKKYKTFSIPKKVRRIDDVAFDGNSYIEKLIINSDICDHEDEGGPCENMKNLRTVIYKVPQTYEDGLCFAGCKKLEKVVLAEGTKSIGYMQFAGCENLTTINFPDSLESIASNAFEGCDKLVLPEFDESKIREIKY